MKRLASLILALLVISPSAQAKEKRPNFLVIVEFVLAPIRDHAFF